MHHASDLLRRANHLVRAGRVPEQSSWRYTIRRQRVCMDPRPSPAMMLAYVFFRSVGCRFDRAGECTMCNYGQAERGAPEEMIESVRQALAECGDCEALGVSPLGNMFDPTEVPLAVRDAIFAMAQAAPGSIVSSESRPETLSEEGLAHATEQLRGKRFFVNLGLESAHPWVQANCVGKSLSIGDYQSAVALLRRYGSFPVSNILLGAPFLTQLEAIDAAAGTVRWAMRHGSHICVLFPSNVKGWTLQEWLWERGMYRPPSLWAVVEVLRRLDPEETRSVVLSWYSTSLTDPRRQGQVSDPLRETPGTCASCHDRVVRALDRFNIDGSHNPGLELSRVRCGCRDEWLSHLEREAATSPPLWERVCAAYERIGTELVGSSWWQARRAEVLARLADGYDGGVSPSLT